MYLRLTFSTTNPTRFNKNNAHEIFPDVIKIKDALKGWNLTQNCRFTAEINPDIPGLFTISIDNIPDVPPQAIPNVIAQVLGATRFTGQYSLFRIETNQQPMPTTLLASKNPSPEHLAVRNNQLSVVVDFLKKDMNIDALDSDVKKMNFLSIASECGHLDIAELLLQNGANPNVACGHLMETALYFAIRNARPLIVALLLKYFANVHVINRTGRKPMDVAIDEWKRDQNNPQRIACITELLDHGAGIGVDLTALPPAILKDKVTLGATLPPVCDSINTLEVFLKKMPVGTDKWLRRLRLFANEGILQPQVKELLIRLIQKLNRIGSLAELTRQQVAKSIFSSKVLLFKGKPTSLCYSDTRTPEVHLNFKLDTQNILSIDQADEILCDTYLQKNLSGIYIKQICDDLHEKIALLKISNVFLQALKCAQVRLELLWRYHQQKYHPDVASACEELAFLYHKNNKHQSAIYTFEKTKEIFFFLTKNADHVSLVHNIVLAQEHINNIRKNFSKELAAEKICEEQICDLAIRGLLNGQGEVYDKAIDQCPSQELRDLIIKRAKCRGVDIGTPVEHRLTMQNDYKSTTPIAAPKP